MMRLAAAAEQQPAGLPACPVRRPTTDGGELSTKVVYEYYVVRLAVRTVHMTW
jgi:hypothetical protein